MDLLNLEETHSDFIFIRLTYNKTGLQRDSRTCGITPFRLQNSRIKPDRFNI